MNIRKAVLTDLHALIDFNAAMALETENKVLSAETLSAGIEAVLIDVHKGFYLVAEKDQQLAGALMLTDEWSDWRNAYFWWIQSVYVRPEFRRQGIYAALYEYTTALAKRAANVCGLRLYVEKDNLVAQQTYADLGMPQSHYLMFETLNL